MMAPDLRALARRFYEEFWCRGNADAADALVIADVLIHDLPAGWPPGRDGFKRLVREWRSGFPDMHETIEDLIVEGDRVVGRFTLRGTHRGLFRGIAPTGRRVEIGGIEILRFADGRIAEWWYSEDTLSLYRQLGLLPPTP